MQKRSADKKDSRTKKIPEAHINTWLEGIYFTVPSIVLTPQEVSRVYISLHEDTAWDIENHANGELVVCEEEDADLNINSIL